MHISFGLVNYYEDSAGIDGDAIAVATEDNDGVDTETNGDDEDIDVVANDTDDVDDDVNNDDDDDVAVAIIVDENDDELLPDDGTLSLEVVPLNDTIGCPPVGAIVAGIGDGTIIAPPLEYKRDFASAVVIGPEPRET